MDTQTLKQQPELYDYGRGAAIRARSERIAPSDADFLLRRVSSDIVERLSVINRTFDTAIDLYTPSHCLAEMINEAKSLQSIVPNELRSQVKITADKSKGIDDLGLAPNSIDLAVSGFGLHWCNDIPGILAQIQRALRPDGLLMAVLPASGTLQELRESLMEAEMGITGGASLRVDPFIEIKQAGDLLMRAGFTLPVTDLDEVVVRYGSFSSLIEDLRAMGVTSSLRENRGIAPRDLFARARDIYHERYADDDGRIRATFRMIHMSGWSPHSSQQKPLKPGSADISLAGFLNKDRKF